jgi:hypothetical protein
VAGHLQLERGLAGQQTQCGFLFGGELSRHAVDDAQRAEGVSIRRDQRGTRVEADIGVAGDERVVGETPVFVSVGDNHQIRLTDGVGAESHVTARLTNRQALNGFEPLAVFVDE